jgi:hypothetical protein
MVNGETPLNEEVIKNYIRFCLKAGVIKTVVPITNDNKKTLEILSVLESRGVVKKTDEDSKIISYSFDRLIAQHYVSGKNN